MSQETIKWLNENVAVGYRDKRGDAWWKLRTGEDDASALNGWQSHFDGPVPEEVAISLLNRVKPIMVKPFYKWTTPDGQEKTREADGKGFIIDEVTGHLYGAHTEKFQIHGYSKWLYKNMEMIAGQGLDVGQVGLLRNGAQAWVSFEMPESMEYKRKGSRLPGVEFRPQLLATTALDGSIATTYKPVFTIVVCDNTRTMALRENTSVYRLKHTKNSELKIGDARSALDITFTMADEFSKELEKLLTTKVSTQQWDAFKELYVPIDPDAAKRGVTMANDKRDRLNSYYESDPMVAPWAGTAYGVIQAVNTDAQHSGIVRKVTRAERNMENTLTGKVDDLDTHAWNTLYKVLEGASA